MAKNSEHCLVAICPFDSAQGSAAVFPDKMAERALVTRNDDLALILVNSTDS